MTAGVSFSPKVAGDSYRFAYWCSWDVAAALLAESVMVSSVKDAQSDAFGVHHPKFGDLGVFLSVFGTCAVCSDTEELGYFIQGQDARQSGGKVISLRRGKLQLVRVDKPLTSAAG